MAEDWRVTFDLTDEGGFGRVLQWLHELEVERAARRRLGDRVAVSGDSRTVFLYAGTEAAAREAEQVVSACSPSTISSRAAWPPTAGTRSSSAWEDARVALPSTAAERQAEHQRLTADEAAESDATGVAAWEVRIEVASHDDADALAARLEGEGMSVVRRSTFLLVGAANEDDARELAQRLASESPPGAVIHVEPGGARCGRRSTRTRSPSNDSRVRAFDVATCRDMPRDRSAGIRPRGSVEGCARGRRGEPRARLRLG